jgi:RNA polymerase sigma-B factor
MAPKKTAERVWSQCRSQVQPQTSPELWQRYVAARSNPEQEKEAVLLRNRIVMANDKLARKIAHRMAGECAEPLEDLIQLAQAGLIRAIEKFNPDQGAAFSSFAVPYIRGEIQHHLRDHWCHVKVPRRSIELASQVKRKQRQLAAQGRTVDAETIAVSLLLKGKYATQEAIAQAKAKWRQVEEEVSRQPLVPLDDVLHCAAPDEDDDRELAARAYQGLGSLEEPVRSIVVGHVFGQLKDEQLALKHSISIEEVRLNIAEGLRQLRDGLGAWEKEA